MSVTEAGRAPELVSGVNVEVSHFAPVTPLPLDVGLAQAVTRVGVAAGSVVQASFRKTATCLATQVAKVPVVGGAGVALFAVDAGFAVAFPSLVALLDR